MNPSNTQPVNPSTPVDQTKQKRRVTLSPANWSRLASLTNPDLAPNAQIIVLMDRAEQANQSDL